MNKILVSYDLMAPGKSYQPVWDYLEGIPGWIKPLRSVYLLKTSKTAGDILDRMEDLVDRNDKVLVMDITDSDWGTYNLPKTSSWLKA